MQLIGIMAVSVLSAFGGYLAAGAAIGSLVLPPDAVLPDGGRYEGQTRNGKFHGQGKITWPDGTSYAGEFVNGQYEGRGRHENSAGEVYEGEFKDGQRHGEGIGKSRYGDTYDGIWREGEIVRGEFMGSGGSGYEGQFKNFMFHGNGEFTDADGNVFRGKFRNGRLEGEGVHESPRGIRYEGEFKANLYNGEGTITWPTGERFVGTFHEGLRNGPGTMYSSSGEVISEGVWYQGSLVAGGDNGDASESRSIENAVYGQQSLIDDALASVASEQPGRIDLYFVGFAPYGGQDVFRKEIEYAAAQVDRHLGAENRTVILGNHPETLESRPLATRTSLERILRHVAGVMNPEEDILFVYLTSHGSEDPTLAVEQPGIELPDLEAAELASIIDSLPSRWTIVGISACYSGGFLDSLRNETTLVMTSARADRTSFGCGIDSDMTYFGKAFFRDALPGAPSLEAAFEKARALVRKREEAEGLPRHSEPQIAVGREIDAHLTQWRASLEARTE